ncbi:MAG TPA: TetR/AcrR family transcriptional regulator [Solirubrobacteraceae bacterium]|nr:TetR/AcrR family transcriptional regulator [Solirubrobacteraceae bacterium]
MTRAEQRARTRSDLLDSAARVFARRGLHAASVDQVAEDAGLTKGAVYSNFASKEELFLAMLAERYAERLAEMRAIAGAAETPEATMQAGGADFAATLDADPEWAALYVEAWAHAVRAPDFAARLVEHHRALRDELAGMVREQQGSRLPFAPERVAAMLLAIGNGFAMEHRLDPEGVPPEVMQQLLAVFAAGLRAMASGR